MIAVNLSVAPELEQPNGGLKDSSAVFDAELTIEVCNALDPAPANLATEERAR